MVRDKNITNHDNPTRSGDLPAVHLYHAGPELPASPLFQSGRRRSRV